jgi:predicted nucleic acid-binding protein
VTVIDSSAFLKYLLKEEGYEDVRPWLQPEKNPYSVSMLLTETGNVLWKYQRNGVIAREIATKLYSEVVNICHHEVIRIEPNETYGSDALRLAMEYNDSFYDMLFVSQAITGQRCLITSDERQAAIALQCGVKVISV